MNFGEFLLKFYILFATEKMVENNVDKNGVDEKNDSEPESSKRRLSTKTSIHVESVRLRSICSILNIDSETFAIKGQQTFVEMLA